jgi:hypothetical protein
MEINQTETYDNASVEDVYALVTDKDFRIETCLAQGATHHEVNVESNSVGGRTVTVVRTMPAELPEFITKFTGHTIDVKQTEVWSDIDDGGNRNCDVRVKIIGQPAEMTGTMTLRAAGGDTVFNLEGHAKVKIPFIGKKIEAEIAHAVGGALRVEARLGNARLS